MSNSKPGRRAEPNAIITALVFAACLIAIGTMLLVPPESKVVDLVYGAF